MQQRIAQQAIEQLSKGLPPQRGVEMYSVGNEKLIEGIKRFHLKTISDQGLIRFVSGSWGAGKTHFFRLLREVAFQNNCLVSDVGLNASDAALNKFERVFYSILRNIITPTYYNSENFIADADPFGRVVQESLAFLANGERQIGNEISWEDYNRASEALMNDRSIDIDFKKMIQEYWKTFLPESAEAMAQEQVRAEILQWFSGEANLAASRRRFNVNKIPNKDNAKLMLQSLAGFVRLSGYRGLVILFDEAEQAYSIMRNSALRDAHNNLLSLINSIESLTGLFLIYATTPDFYTDPKKGIIIYGALAGRIGKPEDRLPSALDTVWNLDAVKIDLSQYQIVARKIKGIYAQAYSEEANELPGETEIDKFVAELYQLHPAFGQVRFWRVLMSALISHFNNCLEGEERPAEQVYDDVMDRLRED